MTSRDRIRHHRAFWHAIDRVFTPVILTLIALLIGVLVLKNCAHWEI